MSGIYILDFANLPVIIPCEVLNNGTNVSITSCASLSLVLLVSVEFGF